MIWAIQSASGMWLVKWIDDGIRVSDEDGSDHVVYTSLWSNNLRDAHCFTNRAEAAKICAGTPNGQIVSV